MGTKNILQSYNYSAYILKLHNTTTVILVTTDCNFSYRGL
uniref:Uncharacterized protein n=1 Tax=Arundo donax TaxID=35708 RepID=A0A0A9ED39_ARUDO